MTEINNSNNPPLTIANLYPQLNEEQRKEAEENLERYLALMMRIYNRIQRSQGHQSLNALTDEGQQATM
jgi:hypothetical protein